MALKKPLAANRKPVPGASKSTIRVYRGGAQSKGAKLVDARPTVYHLSDSVLIDANIAVNKSAARQSDVSVFITEEGLVELFEEHFDLKGMGIGKTAMLVKKTREENNARRRMISHLILFIDDLRRGRTIKWRNLYRDVHKVEALVDSKSLKRLEQAERHAW